MPKPTIQSLNVSKPLTTLSIGWIQDNSNFASGMFGWVPVDDRAGEYYVWDKADLLRSEAELVAPGGLAPIRGQNLTTQPYSCKTYKIRDGLDQQRMAEADDAAELEQNSAEAVTQDIMMKSDKDWVAALFSQSIWTNESQGVAAAPTGDQFYQFSDYSNSTPIEVLRNRARRIQSGTGRSVNTMVMGPLVWDAIADHPDLIQRISANQGPQIPTPALLAQVLGIERVIVPNAVTNSAVEGATESTTNIFGKNLLMGHVAPSPGKRVPSAWYSFTWRGLIGSSSGFRIRRYDVPERDNTRFIEAEAAYDHSLVSNDLGHFMYDVVA